MVFSFNFTDPFGLAVLLLSFIGGFSLASVFKNCISRFILSVSVVIIIILSLLKGYNQGLEDITRNLAYYIIYNPLGLVGFIIGFVFGIIILRKRKVYNKIG